MHKYECSFYRSYRCTINLEKKILHQIIYTRKIRGKVWQLCSNSPNWWYCWLRDANFKNCRFLVYGLIKVKGYYKESFHKLLWSRKLVRNSDLVLIMALTSAQGSWPSLLPTSSLLAPWNHPCCAFSLPRCCLSTSWNSSRHHPASQARSAGVRTVEISWVKVWHERGGEEAQR